MNNMTGEPPAKEVRRHRIFSAARALLLIACAVAPAMGKSVTTASTSLADAPLSATAFMPEETAKTTATLPGAKDITPSASKASSASDATTATATADAATTPPATHPRLSLWADVDNNFAAFGSATSLTLMLDRMKERNIDTLIIEVKPVHGYVTYASKTAPRLTSWRGFTPSPDFDPVATAVKETHARGQKVYLLANVFTGGVLRNPDTGTTFGMVFDGKLNWEAWSYGLAARVENSSSKTTETANIVPSQERPTSLAIYLSPHNPAVRDYQLAVIRELAAYKPDGIILDSLRFADIQSDFSPAAREAFEKSIGQKVVNWPDDILTWKRGGDGIPHYTEGHLFDDWLFFRAKTIRDFFAEATRTVREIDPDIVVEDNTGISYGAAR
ncbi:hypothetical protein CVU37_02930 [candidate division BRC1 bacterium HGW-BRC1-1]|nr:MAG: hypothetical protein CVU37_02930 [candidate division BRC1 bacterium HGW-BRC1-1]